MLPSSRTSDPNTMSREISFIGRFLRRSFLLTIPLGCIQLASVSFAQEPAEQKPAEQKPAEQKPAEQKPEGGAKKKRALHWRSRSRRSKVADALMKMKSRIVCGFQNSVIQILPFCQISLEDA